MTAAHPVLELRHLVKRYGGLVATNDVNLTILPGEIHAIIGPNGAGKTTLIHQISGAIPPSDGKIIFNGNDITSMSMHARVRCGLARSYQITNVFRTCSVMDNLALAVQARSGSSMRFWGPAIADHALFEEAGQIAERIGLAQRLDTLAGRLSHGEQRQLEVGLALATKPRLLLLDEPLAGIGQDESSELVALIQTLAPELAVILIEHDMDAVFRLADRISVLVAGSIISSGLPEEIRQDIEVRKAYLGDEEAA
jgi:branched-chain amino acid transport system ATP-binding protein